MPTLSVCIGVLEPLPLEEAFSVIRDAEIGAVELLGEPGRYDRRALVPALEGHGLRVSGITAAARLHTGRDLAHPDPAVRARTLSHLTDCVEFAEGVGAPVVAVAPSAVGRHWFEADANTEWALAVEGLARLAEAAAAAEVELGLEILNRYATPAVNTVADGLRMIDDAGGGPVGLAVDLFHAAIEESDLPGALRAAAGHLVNVQVADSNREGPGRGALDFPEIARALTETGYSGPLALEAFPRGSGAFPAVTEGRLEEAIGYVREMRPFFESLGLPVAPVRPRVR